MNYILTGFFLTVFALSLSCQNITNSLNDTIVIGDKKKVILKDIYGVPYLERYYSKKKLDSTIYVNDSIRMNVFANIGLDKLAKPTQGYSNLNKYISDNLFWPPDFHGTGIVSICFIVDTTGQIIQPRVLKGINVCNQCSDKAIEITKTFSKWRPAMISNKKKNVLVYYPITFKVR